jgi:hypothetical protein
VGGCGPLPISVATMPVDNGSRARAVGRAKPLTQPGRRGEQPLGTPVPPLETPARRDQGCQLAGARPAQEVSVSGGFQRTSVLVRSVSLHVNQTRQVDTFFPQQENSAKIL